MMAVFGIDENSNPTHVFTILDEDGNAIQPTALALTYFNKDDATIINSRNAQNVLNLNTVVVVNGVVTWSMQQTDTLVVDSTRDYEVHVAEWEWTANGKVNRHVTRFLVTNFVKVT